MKYQSIIIAVFVFLVSAFANAQDYTPHPATLAEVNEAANFTDGFQFKCPPLQTMYGYPVCVDTSNTPWNAVQLMDWSDYGLGRWSIAQGWMIMDGGDFVKILVNSQRNEVLSILVSQDGNVVVYIITPMESVQG